MREGEMRILLLENNVGDAFLFEKRINIEFKGRKFHLRRVSKLEDAVVTSKRWSPDVAVLDLIVPDSVGLETVSKFMNRTGGMPVVVMTGLDEREGGLDAVLAGAQDYIEKGKVMKHPIRNTLLYAITRYWREVEGKSKLTRARKAVERHIKKLQK